MNRPEEQQRRIGKIMVGAMWLLLLGLLTLFFNHPAKSFSTMIH